MFRVLFVLGLLPFAMAATECESFHDVTIPATDDVQPRAFGAIWEEGEYKVARFDVGNTFDYAARPGENFVILAGGVDEGGVRQVDMFWQWHLQCCFASGKCTNTTSGVQSERATQAAGNPVSNGVYVPVGISVGQCPAGFTSGRYSLAWAANSRDFHNNVRSSPWYAASWRKE